MEKEIDLSRLLGSNMSFAEWDRQRKLTSLEEKKRPPKKIFNWKAV